MSSPGRFVTFVLAVGVIFGGISVARAATWVGTTDDLLTGTNWSTGTVPIATAGSANTRNADFTGTAMSFTPTVTSPENFNPRLFSVSSSTSYAFGGTGTITLGSDADTNKYLDCFLAGGSVTVNNAAFDVYRGSSTSSNNFAGIGGSGNASSPLVIDAGSLRMGLGTSTALRNIIWAYGHDTTQQPDRGGDVTVNPKVDLSAISVDQPLVLSAGKGPSGAATVTLNGGIMGHESLTTNISVNTAAPTTGNVPYVSLTGRVVIGGTSVFNGSTTVGNGTLLINGNYNGSDDMTVNAAATLGGTGAVGSNVIANGTISPGSSIGTLSMGGAVTLNGTLLSEVSHPAADLLSVTGAVILGEASILDLPLSNTYDPDTTYLLISAAGGVGGTFASFVNPIPVTHQLKYSDNAVSLVPATQVLVGDYNGDNRVDAADYAVWRKNLGGPGDTILNRDPANSGPVNEADYTHWRNHFGNSSGVGTGSGVSSAAVPEPSSLFVFGAIVVAIGVARLCHCR